MGHPFKHFFFGVVVPGAYLLPLGQSLSPGWFWRHFLNYERHRQPGSGREATSAVAKDAADVDPRYTKTRGRYRGDQIKAHR